MTVQKRFYASYHPKKKGSPLPTKLHVELEGVVVGESAAQEVMAQAEANIEAGYKLTTIYVDPSFGDTGFGHTYVWTGRWLSNEADFSKAFGS